MNVTKYLKWVWEIIGEKPQTSLWMTSKHFAARLPKLGKGRVLLLPNLQVEQSKEATENWFLFPNKPEFDKWDNTIEFGCPRRLWQTSVLLAVEVQAKDRTGGMEKCIGNSRPTLGPYTIIIPDTWSCTIQPLREKFTSQLLSTNCPIEIRLVESFGETKTFLKVGVMSPTLVMGKLLPLAICICDGPWYLQTFFRMLVELVIWLEAPESTIQKLDVTSLPCNPNAEKADTIICCTISGEKTCLEDELSVVEPFIPTWKALTLWVWGHVGHSLIMCTYCFQ